MEICIYWDNWVKKEFAAKEKLEIVQSERVASVGGRGGIAHALQILRLRSGQVFGEIC